jgi:hypothetical protein
MKRKYPFVVIFLLLAMLLVSCGGDGIITPSTNITGKRWLA